MEIKTAFVLAAGYGKRLAPITDIAPKPLLKISGKPLLFSIFDKLAKAGIARTIVNTHHLDAEFDKAFAPFTKPQGGGFECGKMDFEKIFEPEILDTGGALKNAAARLAGVDALLVHNGDILFTADIKRFLAAARAEFERAPDTAAVLCLRDSGAVCNVGVRGSEVVDMRFALGAESERNLQFTGVFAAGRKFLDAAQNFPKDVFSTVDVILQLLAQKRGRIAFVEENGGTWNDIGTPEQYLKACKKDGDSLFADIAKIKCFGFSPKEFSAINKGASTRRFVRFTDAETDAQLVACFYDGKKREDALYAKIGKFLAANSVDVPEILKSCGRRKMLVMRSGGDTDLLSIAAENPFAAAYYYGLAVENLRKLHTAATENFAKKPFEISQSFDEKLYDWEQNYFREECLKSRFGADSTPELDAELARIKSELLAQPLALLHRDFQSQNIMVNGREISIIDFQGMRLGCALYDLASLLCDPYVELPDGLVGDLLRLYFRGKPNDAQMRIFRCAACERLMQALGAFGFLSIKRGKSEYANYIVPALERLAKNAELGGFDALKTAAEQCLKKAQKQK